MLRYQVFLEQYIRLERTLLDLFYKLTNDLLGLPDMRGILRWSKFNEFLEAAYCLFVPSQISQSNPFVKPSFGISAPAPCAASSPRPGHRESRV